jgi:hypothetical protein
MVAFPAALRGRRESSCDASGIIIREQTIVAALRVRILPRSSNFVADVFSSALRNTQKQEISPHPSRFAHEISMPLLPPRLLRTTRRGAYPFTPGIAP